MRIRIQSRYAPAFGWDSSNYIGATPQKNTWEPDWATFFWNRRLLPQLRLAIDLIPSSRWNRLEQSFFRLMDGHVPQPSFLHGDLWGGNAASIAENEPVVFDPASYFGDRETDIAFPKPASRESASALHETAFL